jgi:hypothetical protein
MKKENSNDKNLKLTDRGEYNSPTSLTVIIIMGITSMLLWIVMFSLGLLINSKPYRDTILSHFGLPDFFMSIITYTPTNIAFLCIIAAFSGGCASRLVIIGIHKDPASDSQISEKDKTDSQLYMTENPFSSMLRGLVVYFAFLAGVFVAAPNPFAETSPQQYAQAAGVVSLFSFIVGYDPTVFRSFISLAGKMKQKNDRLSTKTE